MIEINELRVTNLVKCKTSNDAGVYTVDAIDGIHNKIYLSNPRNVWHSLDKIRPIKLTEDWLVKFGFIKKYDWFYKDKFLLGYLTTEDNLQSEWKFSGTDCSWNLLNIKYVHQLQNLFFALTGEELKSN